MSELRTAATWAARCMHSMLTNGEWYSAEKCLANLYHAIEQHEKQEILTIINPQSKPLSDEQIIAAIKNISYNEMSAFNIARAIEKAHGIGVNE